MSALIVNGVTPFGNVSNKMAADFHVIDDEITRLGVAVAIAASGFTGTAGTEYETGSNFGVVPSNTPGQQGLAFAYALNSLSTNWATFRANNIAFINVLDNGG